MNVLNRIKSSRTHLKLFQPSRMSLLTKSRPSHYTANPTVVLQSFKNKSCMHCAETEKCAFLISLRLWPCTANIYSESTVEKLYFTSDYSF